jgi:hypothetical protein
MPAKSSGYYEKGNTDASVATKLANQKLEKVRAKMRRERSPSHDKHISKGS